MKVPFNKPHRSGKELDYIREAIDLGKLSGDGNFTRQCHSLMSDRFGFKKCLLTTSCTDALEMTALLLDIKPGDEVIVPSYTFVSSANAFALRGAKLLFADSTSTNPNVDPEEIRRLISPKTKAIVVVHYAGIACDMHQIMQIADDHGVPVVEDAAQAIDSYFEGRPLGSIGRFGCFSFHETKNIICGEGGMLCVNDDADALRAEIIREKGTNRTAFFRGEVDKYGWVDLGSSFLPSEINAAYLFAQLEQLDGIQNRRKEIWKGYYQALAGAMDMAGVMTPHIPNWATNNAHMFYLVCRSGSERVALIAHLRDHGILAVSHYLSLEDSKYYKEHHDGRSLSNSKKYTECLVRLPLFVDMTDEEVGRVNSAVLSFYRTNPIAVTLS